MIRQPRHKQISSILAVLALGLFLVPTPTQAGLKDGTLVRQKDQSTVYVLEYGTKRPFGSAVVFAGLGYDWANVKVIDSVASYPNGALLAHSQQRHVRGSVVVGKGTDRAVYFLGATQRYPFSSWDDFLAWGLTSRDIITASSYDFALPIGPAVTPP